MKNANVPRTASTRLNLMAGLAFAALAACAGAEVIEPEVLARVPSPWTPFTPLIQAPDGNFYGATLGGGSAGLGVIYRTTPAGAVTTVVEFTDSRPGTAPLVADDDGNLYGTAINGGPGGQGTVYKVTSAGVQTHLFHFNGTNGAVPLGLARDNLGNLYGVTVSSATDPGMIFKLAPDGTFMTLHRFLGDTFPAMLIIGRDGQLYGRTYHNVTGRGIAYRFSLSNGTFATLAQLTGSTIPLSTFLTHAPDGYLYGTTSLGGTTGNGTLFRISTQGGGATTLLQFDGANNGAQPGGPLAVDRDGNLYGTTWFGGGGYNGAVFKMTPAGVFTTLAYFTPSTGVNPFAGVTLGMDGNLYGTVARTIFRVALPGGDTDSDGVPNDADECADTPTGAIVNADGCSLDQLVPCAGSENHGHYLSALAVQLAEFVSQGRFSLEQAHDIFTAAAQSNCGKKLNRQRNRGL